ncbi:hypothetical protein E4U26_006745 [Claviceps purpurea]|nr:hypothetical protein E4U26_006745 [Claviceps purpurea]
MDDLPMHLHLLSQIEQIEVSSSRFERLRGSWNIEKAKEWTHANAKCLSIMLDGLTSDDAVIIDEYETAAAVWAQLQKRYGVAAYPPSGGDLLVLCRKKYPISSRKEEYQTASSYLSTSRAVVHERLTREGEFPAMKGGKEEETKQKQLLLPSASKDDVAGTRGKGATALQSYSNGKLQERRLGLNKSVLFESFLARETSRTEA